MCNDVVLIYSKLPEICSGKGFVQEISIGLGFHIWGAQGAKKEEG
jgi:hypothetical protein